MASPVGTIETIDALVGARAARSDAELLAELAALPALADEQDALWDDDAYLRDVVTPYLALAKLARQRRLRAAVRMLLDRACFGDPYEIMRGLRHTLEAIMEPAALAEVCMDAVRSHRSGTRLWAVKELEVLDDERARPLLEQMALDRDDES